MYTEIKSPAIYQIRHIESEKIYVGSSANPYRRCISHQSKLRRCIHDSRYLQNAWNKYGSSAFAFEIIEIVGNIEELPVREQYWINRLQSANREYGFNVMPVVGSSLGMKRTDETRLKLREIRKKEASNPIVQERLASQSRTYWDNPESRERLRLIKREHFNNPEVIARMAEGQRKYASQPHVREMRSRKTTKFYQENPERRTMAAVYASKEYVLTAPDGTIYEVRNLKQFCKEHDLTERTMHRILKGQQEYHKGWTCRRKE